MVAVKGLEKFAPKDFPGFLSATVFVGGCNFRCPFCHNAELVLRPHTLPDFPLDFLVDFLDSRKGWLEGVCITGGEPLLHEDLDLLCSVFKERGYLVKIDTNGSFPDRLEQLIATGLVDHIAMDVKAPVERYELLAGTPVDVNEIERSVRLIRHSELEHVFRTTVVPGLVEAEDIERIARWLDGVSVFQIQQFFPHNALDPKFQKKKPFSAEQVRDFARLAEPYCETVRVEGV